MTGSARQGRLIGWLVAASILTFAAFLVLAAYAPTMRFGRAGQVSVESKALNGFAGLAALLRAVDGTVGVPTEPARDPALLIVPLDPAFAPRDIRRLAMMRDDLPTLFVLPKRAVMPLLQHRGWVLEVDTLPEGTVTSLIKAAGFALPPLAMGRVRGRVLLDGQPTAARLSAPARFVARGADAELLVKAADQPHWLLTDPTLLDNGGLRFADNAVASVALVHRLSPVGHAALIDASIERMRIPRSLFRLLLMPPFLTVTLSLLLAGVVLLTQGLGRFGPSLRAPRAIPAGKRALVDATAALLARAGAIPRLGERYARLAAWRARDRLGGPAHLTGSALTRWLDTRDRAAPFTPLAVAVADADGIDALASHARATRQWIRDHEREQL